MGVFAGKAFQKGQEVTTGDAVVPLRDMDHNPTYNSGYYFLWDDYIWSGETFGGMTEPGHKIDGASFGIGAAPNCFFALLNVEERGDVRRDYAGLPRTSPGMGAFTAWHDRRSHAERDIQAGEEIFVDYGYGYFENERESKIGLVPFWEHLEQADALLNKFTKIRDLARAKQQKTCRASSENNQCSVGEWSLLDDLYSLTRNILTIIPNRVLWALPETTESIDHILATGGSTFKDYNRSIRELDYLQENGVCMDLLRVKPSTISHAGRGTFAAVDMPAGTTVAPVPLIHLPKRSVLDIVENGVIVHSQLLLNYCFGHRESTLLLCPYGVASALVNHGPTPGSTRDTGNVPTANVKIKWSEKVTLHPEWLAMPIELWANDYKAGLAFEYVALRDIRDGEEIFLDYGEEWETAWRRHVADWKPAERLVDHLNQDMDLVIPTESEWTWQCGDPNENPNAVNVWCRDIYREMQGLPFHEGHAWPCKVISRTEASDGSLQYNAEIVIIDQGIVEEEQGDEVCHEQFDEVLWSLPRDAFIFGAVDEVFDTREYILHKSFRHDLRVPDDIMPDAWKLFPESIEL
jgi:hypothetical protein